MWLFCLACLVSSMLAGIWLSVRHVCIYYRAWTQDTDSDAPVLPHCFGALLRQTSLLVPIQSMFLFIVFGWDSDGWIGYSILPWMNSDIKHGPMPVIYFVFFGGRLVKSLLLGIDLCLISIRLKCASWSFSRELWFFTPWAKTASLKRVIIFLCMHASRCKRNKKKAIVRSKRMLRSEWISVIAPRRDRKQSGCRSAKRGGEGGEETAPCRWCLHVHGMCCLPFAQPFLLGMRSRFITRTRAFFSISFSCFYCARYLF